MNKVFFALLIVALLTCATAFPFDTTTFGTTPNDSCDACRDSPVHVDDTWAGQCFPMEDHISCNCVCGSVFCNNNEIIDRTTCRPDGSIQDCRCIPLTTTVHTPTN